MHEQMKLWRRARTSACASVLALAASGAFAASVPSGFTDAAVTGSSLSSPVMLAVAPDGRVFVSEKAGRVRVIKDTTLLATPFVSVAVNSSNERGMLGLAFDPADPSAQYLYMYYTQASPQQNVVARVRRSAGNPDVADASTLQVLFRIPYRGNVFHHGGGLQFGADGKLYASIGDHQSGSGQDLGNLWGKVIRINSDGSIPTDNPFYGTTNGDNRAIWAYGFRNPFAMDVQPGTGVIFVNDAGNSAGACCEEVNRLSRAGNFGWPPASNGAGAWFRYTASQQGGNVITGGDFYNPVNSTFPSNLIGRYFLADYGGGWIRHIASSGSAGSLTGFASGISGPTDVEVHPNGTMYYTAHNGGQVRYIRGPAATPTPRSTPTPTPVVTPTPTPRNTPTPTPIVTPTPTPRNTPTPTPIITPTPTPPGDFVEVTPGANGVSASTNDGNVPANAVDNNLATRWSGNGRGAWLQLDLGSPQRVAFVRIAWFMGDTRRNEFALEHSSDGTNWNVLRPTTQSSGTTTLEEQFDFDDVTARYVRYVGNGNNAVGKETWNSVTEISVFAAIGPIPTPTPTPRTTPTPTPTTAPVEITPPCSGVSASTHDGNVPCNVIDNNLGTRWSAMGDPQWIQLDLGSTRTVTSVSVAVYNGNARRNDFEIQTATTPGAWSTAFDGQSSGTTTLEESYDIPDVAARYVRYLGHGSNVSTWNSVTEISVFGTAGTPTGPSVSIMGFAFVPDTITIQVGESVTWTNMDGAQHTVTSDTGLFDSGLLATGQTFTRRFDTAGTYPYHCEPHPHMMGRVVVIGGPTPTPTVTPTLPPRPTPTPTVRPTPSDDTPVGINGQLHVCGTKLCNQYNNPIQLRGMSSHGLQWYPDCINNTQALDALANDWQADVVRVSMYVQEGGYQTDPARFTALADSIIDKVIARGMYVVIDWHQLNPGDPNYNLARARTYFTHMTQRYGHLPNVIYEIANEPSGVSWSTIRNYAIQINQTIRANDPDNVILIGTRAWSSLGMSDGMTSTSGPNEVINNQVPGTNLMYVFHMYAASHMGDYRAALSYAADRIPMFVTEWGTQTFTGDGGNNFSSSQQYVDLMREKKISWVNWNFSDDFRSGAVLTTGTCGANNGGGPYAGTSRLKPAGVWIRERIRTPADDFPVGPIE